MEVPRPPGKAGMSIFMKWLNLLQLDLVMIAQ
jgi:hypothetical protein